MSGEVNMDDLKDVPVCRRLRTKSRDAILQSWFPSRTATVLGPDDVFCSPQVCQPHRACFETE